MINDIALICRMLVSIINNTSFAIHFVMIHSFFLFKCLKSIRDCALCDNQNENVQFITTTANWFLNICCSQKKNFSFTNGRKKYSAAAR